MLSHMCSSKWQNMHMHMHAPAQSYYKLRRRRSEKAALRVDSWCVLESWLQPAGTCVRACARHVKARAVPTTGLQLRVRGCKPDVARSRLVISRTSALL